MRTTHRAVGVLDLENLLYDQFHASQAALEATFADLTGRCRGYAPAAQLVGYGDYRLARRLVAPAHHHNVRLFPTRPGPDHADQHLLACLDRTAETAADTVIVASGDHIFAAACLQLELAGKHVVCLAEPSKLSDRLYRATQTYLPWLPATEPASHPPLAA